MQKDIKLSIVIPTVKWTENLSRLLDDLATQKADFDFEVIVVSNPACGVCERKIAAKAIAGFFHLGIAQKGVNRARNAGVKAARGSLIALLDDDCRVPRTNHLSELVKYHEENPTIFAYGGGYEPRSRLNVFERVYHMIAESWLEKSCTESQYTRRLIGGNVSYKKDLLLGLGLFNESILFGGSESELHSRAVLQGYKLVYNSRFKVVHHSQIGFLTFVRKAFMQGQGKRFQVSHGTATYWPETFDWNLYLSKRMSRSEKWVFALYQLLFSAGQAAEFKDRSLFRILLHALNKALFA